ncbi:MAG TPA: acyl carrier protein [Candidatus Ornithomonoglobus intestinigallinarum]|jgi:methoxymalonate biosynthesis acyl carrier protein|uniref:Acyl carrier protein n=1 Tax=Candidatus Ornithomonoglobus intestinigallinarum TaxID=2840894 RepID=A0A9D1H5C2_9FIRM|nr:acyl carrier protein [Candidatus Ornithomonoglobus intestinigallinarum]
MTTQERILKFFGEKNITGIDCDTDLFKGGYVNSLFALEIVMFLEKEFKIKIKNKDITEKNFKTVNSMAEVVEKYL